MLEGFKSAIREGLSSKRHVSGVWGPGSGIPRTVNGEKIEMVVKEVISSEEEEEGEGEGGRRKVSETVVNPKAVECFWRFRDWEGDEEEEEVLSKERSKL